MKREKDAHSQIEPPPSLVLKIQRSIRRRGLKGILVLENIERSIDAHPREFRIALYDPPQRENLAGDSAFQTVARTSSHVIYGPGGHRPQPAASFQTNA